jgi:hypothetical protein
MVAKIVGLQVWELLKAIVRDWFLLPVLVGAMQFSKGVIGMKAMEGVMGSPWRKCEEFFPE